MNISSKVYLSEEQLVELFQQQKMNWVQYVELHSEEMKDDYRDYCIVNGIDCKSEQSARQYLQNIKLYFF